MRTHHTVLDQDTHKASLQMNSMCNRKRNCHYAISDAAQDQNEMTFQNCSNSGDRGIKSVRKIYKIGTLRYTAGSLVVIFSWLLLGHFCFTIFETMFAQFLPLYMKELHASNTLIGVMTGSIAGMLNILFLPNISMASDHYRSRWGRRIPFLLWATPCTVTSLILVGYAPEIGAWLNSVIVARFWPVSQTTAVLIGLCVFVVLYHFFNMVLVNMFNCLLRDVVPGEVMVHFLMWFRVVGGLGGFAFSWYIFKYVLVDRQIVCVGVGALYLGSFLLMCWRVKEGAYQAPPPHAGSRSFFGHFGAYFKECLSIPLYRNFFLSNALLTTSYACAGPFAILFARDTLGISMEDIGKIYTYGGLAGLALLLPFGYFCRRFNAMRVTLASLFGFVIASIFALLFVKDRTGWLLYILLITPPTVGWSLAFTTVTMSLFPSEKFGQFSSNLNVLGCGSLIFGNYLMGQIIDWTGSNYRICFLWSAFFFLMAALLMLRVYRDWKRHGGPNHYSPPLPHSMVTSHQTEQAIEAVSVCCLPNSVRDDAAKQS